MSKIIINNELAELLRGVSTEALREMCRNAGMTCLQVEHPVEIQRNQLIGWMSVAINLNAWKKFLIKPL